MVAGQTSRPEGAGVVPSMSTLGQKQTSRRLRIMSALPAKADIALTTVGCLCARQSAATLQPCSDTTHRRTRSDLDSALSEGQLAHQAPLPAPLHRACMPAIAASLVRWARRSSQSWSSRKTLHQQAGDRQTPKASRSSHPDCRRRNKSRRNDRRQGP